VNADLLFFRLAALKSLDLAPAIPAFFALPAEKIASSYFTNLMLSDYKSLFGQALIACNEGSVKVLASQNLYPADAGGRAKNQNSKS